MFQILFPNPHTTSLDLSTLLSSLSLSTMMVSNRSVTALLFLLLAGFVSSDFTKDRNDCADKLVTLAGCLPYVGGTANTPTIDCCTSLKQVLDKTKKCICILIKDRNDPKLGIKLNATLAVQLPNACHIPSNITECVGKYIFLMILSIYHFSLLYVLTAMKHGYGHGH